MRVSALTGKNGAGYAPRGVEVVDAPRVSNFCFERTRRREHRIHVKELREVQEPRPIFAEDIEKSIEKGTECKRWYQSHLWLSKLKEVLLGMLCVAF